jgi:hypothetical protein
MRRPDLLIFGAETYCMECQVARSQLGNTEYWAPFFYVGRAGSHYSTIQTNYGDVVDGTLFGVSFVHKYTREACHMVLYGY